MADNSAEGSYIELTANIVSAYVSNNSVPSADIPALISQVHSALKRVSGGQVPAAAEPLKPAIALQRSFAPYYIVCLDDVRKSTSLKRHLRTPFNMSSDTWP